MGLPVELRTTPAMAPWAMAELGIRLAQARKTSAFMQCRRWNGVRSPYISKVTSPHVSYSLTLSLLTVPQMRGEEYGCAVDDYPSNRRPPRIAASREQAVERAESYVRAHPDSTVPISQLCRIAGVSERGLRNAFHSVRGMSPKQYLLTERLHGVRRALSDTGRPPTTVTDVATNYGFFELGRFAASYREAFGEAPSETLRAAMRRARAD